MSWTPQAIATLKRLHRRGIPMAAIAEKLGVSRNAVIGKAHRLDLPTRSRGAKAVVRPAPAAPAPVRSPAPVAPVAPVTPVPAVAAVAPVEPVQPVAPVRFLELRSCHCRWIIGEVRGPETMFCGEPKADPSKPYCAAHRDLARSTSMPRVGWR